MACLWDVPSGRLRRWQAHAGNLDSAAFSPDGKLFLTAAGDVRVRDAETLAEVMTLDDLGVFGATFCAEGRWIASASRDGTRIWPVDPWQRARELAPRELTRTERERYGLELKQRP